MNAPVRFRLMTVAIAAAGSLALTACSGGGSVPGSPAESASLTVGLIAEPTNLDIRHTSGAALEQALIGNVYEGLVARAIDGDQVVPALAESWEVSDDALTYTFHLADGVSFHDGSPMTSADALASLTTVKSDPSVNNHAVLADAADISAPDESTITITLDAPNQNFLFALTGPAGLVLPAEDDTDRRTAANGTGPFTLDSWSRGDALSLVRNEDYWGEPAGVAEVSFVYFGDQAALVSGGRDGSVDAMPAIDPELSSQLSGEFTIVEATTTDKFILAFNSAAAPLDDVRVREALRRAIDHDAILAAVGAAEPLFGPIPPLDPGYEDLAGIVPHDPEGARKLLAEAGVEDLSLELTISNHYGPRLPTLLVSAFADIGVALEVNTVEFATWLSDVHDPSTRRDWQLSIVNHVEPRDFSTWTDPDYYYAIHDEAVLTAVQERYAEAMAEIDQDASAELLAEAAQLVAEWHPADWLYVRQDVIAVAPGVTGFPTAATSTRLPLAGVTVER
ncbi:ABC transporter substrate-binding protein [Microbacterium amylolyticum]|uniref:Peptide/nickel transport system substrate-binding protein n=1 Tax=Microbacterium amylolyticum TaxID=936337 RepID=A0ABS4ZG57_9MICO|nr:ABC transporter substrate-binding protein [Microbacterium amylolyticum]MBP2436271.1 peptide/nickel transport system substrate-binding protein [Microbacterium amylolyticum]